MERCKVCGRVPAQTLAFRRHVGMVLLQSDRRFKAPLCREHGIEVGRTFLRKTLLQGWWGIVSFFWNFYDVFLDAGSLRKAKRLGQPVDPATQPQWANEAQPAGAWPSAQPAPEAKVAPPPAPGLAAPAPPPQPGQFTG